MINILTIILIICIALETFGITMRIINKIKHILGYEPQLSLEEGLLKFTNWIKQKNYFNNHYEESLNIMKGKGILSPGIRNEDK